MNCSAWARSGFALAAISLMAAGEVSAQDVSGKPNFLIIVTDDQGYAGLSAYKHHVKDVYDAEHGSAGGERSALFRSLRNGSRV